MQRLVRASVSLGLMLVSGLVPAASGPDTGSPDARIRVVPYQAKGVTEIRVQRGVVTRIVLERDEKIEVPVVGLSSDCKSEHDEWCVSAITGSSQIFVRPKDGATRNNMELSTNKRDYSLLFLVVSEAVGAQKKAAGVPADFRVVFEYPKAAPPTQAAATVDRGQAVEGLLRRVESASAPLQSVPSDPDYGMTPRERLRAEGMHVRNAHYSKQVLPGGEDADPMMVFDDGRFTYFEFPGAREIPAVFAYGSDGQPTRVNWHMSGNFLVVQRTAPKFTLRLGNAVVGIFNEAFDPTGIETPTSTVSPAVVRTVRRSTP